MKLDSLRTLYVAELQDLHSAEEQLTRALPKMIEAANTPELKRALQEHLQETRVQVERLDRILERLDEKPGKTCKAMEGLVKEGNERVKASGDAPVIDAALIAAAQRVEHYEIAGYGCARTYAGMLGETEAMAMLSQTLDEEKRADQTLTQLAEDIINVEAAHA
jgi:ferritin-like metal-binding protein YciE